MIGIVIEGFQRKLPKIKGGSLLIKVLGVVLRVGAVQCECRNAVNQAAGAVETFHLESWPALRSSAAP